MGICQSNSSPVEPKTVSVSKKEESVHDEKTNEGQFKYQTGTCALEYWEPVRELGEGSISSIHLVRRRPSRVVIPYKERVDIMSMASKKKISNEKEDLYALKSIIKSHVRNDKYLQEMRNEIYTMSRLDHPNIAKVYEAYERKRHIYLVMEYCSGGNLYDVTVTEAQARNVVQKILKAVAYMHQHKVVHRDLKLENILLSKRGKDAELKIIDFGLATRYLSDEYKYMTDRVGTLYSMAPQVLQGVYDLKCDIWSVGVITYMLLLPMGNSPFWGPPREMSWGKRKAVMIDRIMRCQYTKMKGPAWAKVSREAKDFVAQLLQMDPKKRPSALEALELPWIKQIGTDSTDSSTVVSSQDDTLSEEMDEVKRSTRSVLAKKLTNDEIIALKAKLESMDVKHTGHVRLQELLDAVEETHSNDDEMKCICTKFTHDISCNENSSVDSPRSVDYFDLIADILMARSRRDFEVLTESIMALDSDDTGKARKEAVEEVLKKNSTLSQERVDSVLKQAAADANDLVSIQRVLDILDHEMSNQVEAVWSCRTVEEVEDEDETEEDLIDAKDAIIPGGRNDPSERPCYVYDESTNSLRKCVCD